MSGELCILDKARPGREGKGRSAASRLVSSVSLTTMPGICYTGIVIVTVQISPPHTTFTKQTILGHHGGEGEGEAGGEEEGGGGGRGPGWGVLA